MKKSEESPRLCPTCQVLMVSHRHLSTDDYPVEVCPLCRLVETRNITYGWWEVKGPINWQEACPLCHQTAEEFLLHPEREFLCTVESEWDEPRILGGDRGWGGGLL